VTSWACILILREPSATGDVRSVEILKDDRLGESVAIPYMTLERLLEQIQLRYAPGVKRGCDKKNPCGGEMG
jgi:hypothetical protein